jgi:hypothetical protein
LKALSTARTALAPAMQYTNLMSDNNKHARLKSRQVS